MKIKKSHLLRIIREEIKDYTPRDAHGRPEMTNPKNRKVPNMIHPSEVEAIMLHPKDISGGKHRISLVFLDGRSFSFEVSDEQMKQLNAYMHFAMDKMDEVTTTAIDPADNTIDTYTSGDDSEESDVRTARNMLVSAQADISTAYGHDMEGPPAQAWRYLNQAVEAIDAALNLIEK